MWKKNLNNFRGISFFNSLGKLVNTILYNRVSTNLQNINIYLQHKLDLRTIEYLIIFSLFSASSKSMWQRVNIYIPTLLTFTKRDILLRYRAISHNYWASIGWHKRLINNLPSSTDTSNGNNKHQNFYVHCFLRKIF